MKSTFDKLTLVLLLLVIVAALPAQADSYKGTMTRLGTKLEYSFSGGVVNDKKLIGKGSTDMNVYYYGEVEAGSTVSATFKKLADNGKLEQDVKVEIIAYTNGGGIKNLKDGKGKASATASAKVPDNAKEITISMTFTGRMGRYSCIVSWNVVKNASTKSGNKQSSSVGNSEPLSKTITNDNGKFKYTFSGGQLNKKVNGAYEVSPGTTISMAGNILSLSDKLKNGTVKISSNRSTKYSYVTRIYLKDYKGNVIKDEESPSSGSLSYTIPNNMKGEISGYISFNQTQESNFFGKSEVPLYTVGLTWNVVNKSNKTNKTETKQEKKSTTNKSFNWDDVASDDRCHFCNGQFSYYYIGYSLQGSVIDYCNSNPKKSQRRLTDGLDPIYYNDFINTGSDSEVILDYKDERSVLMIKENSLVHLVKRNANGNDRWDVHKGCIVGKGLKHKTSEPEFHMSQCVAKPTGTTYVLQDDGKTSRVLLLEGSMEVTSNKGSKKQTLQPGQVATVTSKGQMTVDNFDVSATAKKYGITGVSAPKNAKSTNTSKQNTSKQNTSSNTNSQKAPKTKATNKAVDKKKSSDVISNSNSSSSSSSGNVGKYARYGAKRGIVKRVEDGGDIRMYITTWWDDYGRLERSEITRCEEKVSGKWKSATAPQIVNIIIDDKHYMYSKSTGWKQSKNTETNFLGSGSKTVSGCKLEKSGTAKVNGKQCDVFKGKRGSTTIEYYIWEGVPMKRVEKDSDGTTTTTVESIELPASIDSSKFSIPKGAIK